MSDAANRDKSIHPRIWNGSDKSNTCKPRKAGKKGKLAKKQARLSARRIDHSLTLKSLPSGTNPMGFRTPGSMK